MPVKKDLTEKLDALVNYILEHTADGNWVTLTYRDIAKIVDTAPGSSITKRLMESLKEHENILFKLDLDPKKSKKPLQFKFVDKDEKFEAIDNKKYKNLTTEEVDFIKEKLGFKDHAVLYNILTYINYLKSEYEDKAFDLPDAEYISDLLLILEQDILYMNDFLLSSNILVDRNGKYSLSFIETGTENLKNSKNEAELTPSVPASPVVNSEHLGQLSAVDKLNMLIELKLQQDLIFDQLKSDIENEASKVSAMQKQLDEGHEIIQRFLAQNQELLEKNEQLATENAKLKATLERSVRFKDNLTKEMQESLQIFNWQVGQIALEDSKQSVDVKNSMSYRAKLSQQYMEVGNDLYKRMLAFMKG